MLDQDKATGIKNSSPGAITGRNYRSDIFCCCTEIGCYKDVEFVEKWMK
jgi:hypothetical protein